jgi:hypothetical protein
MENLEESVLYYNLREGLQSRAKLIPINVAIETLIKNRDRDWYISLYKYTEKHLELLKHKGTLSGVTDTIGDRLYFDFDSEGNLSQAREDATITARRLVEDYGFSEESVNLYFTGGKGFAVEVVLADEISPEDFKKITFKIAGDLDTFDQVVNDPNRIIRVVNTKHQSSGLYKIQLDINEFIEMSMNDILELAKSPRERNFKITAYTAKLPESLLNLESTVAVQEVLKELSFDLTQVDFSQKPRDLDKARWLLMNGYFKHGERNPAMLCIAATCKNLGYSEAFTRNILRGVAEDQASRTGEDAFPEKEIKPIVKQVYGPNWKGGQFTTRDENNWLYKYALKMGVLEKEENGPMQIVDVEQEFTSFVQNYEQNRIMLGIPYIDRLMPVTVGTNLAVVGAPGSGKTTIALNILKNTSQAGLTSVFFSLDMHRKRMFEKIMYDVSGLNRDELYGAFREGKGSELTAKMKEKYGNVWFYDRSGTKPADMAEYIKMVEQHTGTKVKLVMIDYFERVSSEKSSDTEASKDIASKIQDLVMDLDIACITLVQPNKASYNGGPDTPIESYTAIKGSSYLQQSYRNIISIWRPFFNPKLKEFDHFVELAILKNDLGELGHVVMGFDGKRGKVDELEDIEYQEYKEAMNYKKQLKSQENNNDGWN